MTLHDRDSVREQLDESVFAGQDLNSAVPKFRFPPDVSPPDQAFQIVSDELMLDGNSRQNLATFCQTWEEPYVHRLMELSIDKNMIDRDEYPRPQRSSGAPPT
jgi:glutamate decarboxylase